MIFLKQFQKHIKFEVHEHKIVDKLWHWKIRKTISTVSGNTLLE